MDEMKKRKSKYIFILPDARLDYKQREIDTFVRMWNDGESVSAIAEKLWIRKFEVGLIVMHCELEGLISPREGGLHGTKAHKWEQRGKGKQNENE